MADGSSNGCGKCYGFDFRGMIEGMQDVESNFRNIGVIAEKKMEGSDEI